MIERLDMSDREQWLEKRAKRIGGSDIACIMGLNPWKTNVQLWREKMGIETPADISNEAAVQYGVKAEPVIRELFVLNHDDLRIDYIPNNLWLNDEYPFAHASLDGWLEREDREMGVLEIKTGTITSAKSAGEWSGRIPDHYYCQVLWYMMVTGSRFAWLTALLKDRRYGGQKIKDYCIERDSKVETDISIIAGEAERFWKSMQEGTEPALILPKVV